MVTGAGVAGLASRGPEYLHDQGVSVNSGESDGVRVAAADLEFARFELDNVKYELRDRLLTALKTGVSREKPADEAGLTLQQLEAIVRLPG